MPVLTPRALLALAVFVSLTIGPVIARAAPVFRLPTANQAIFEAGGEERYFVGTAGKSWVSGTFGCVRSEGQQLHEGIDIRCLRRDTRGEPFDPILAAADGTVAYLNPRSALSNFGQYIVLRHAIEGMEVFTFYAHLSQLRPGLAPGMAVQAGETIGTMGRTANTRQVISKDRAHLHFEINFFLNDRFAQWYQKTYPDQRNDHGVWNGQNLVGLDPKKLYQQQTRADANFRLGDFLRQETELCRVLVRKTQFPFLRRYAPLVVSHPAAQPDGIAAYEISLNYAGLPFRLVPRTAAQVKSGPKYQLLSVNAAEQARNPARHLVSRRAGRWTLAPNGIRLLDLLTY